MKFSFSSLRKAFTLVEFVLVIGIVGIIAAITITPLLQHENEAQLEAGKAKAAAILNQSVILYHNKYSDPAICGYLGDVPKTDDCGELYSFFTENLISMKVCDSNARGNGCVTQYDFGDIDNMQHSVTLGYSSLVPMVYAAETPSISDSLANSSAFVLRDGMTYFADNKNAIIMGVDVNGFKGPNKIGKDVIILKAFLKNTMSDPLYVEVTADEVFGRQTQVTL